MFTKLKKVIVKLVFKRSIRELENQGAVLKDISINIEEIDGEVYGKLEMVNVLGYYSANIPIPIWQVNQARSIEGYSKGWKFYFSEEMDEVPETI